MTAQPAPDLVLVRAAATLIQTLVALRDGTPLTPAERTTRRAEVEDALDLLPLLVAVFEGSTSAPSFANAAWRARFSSPPAELAAVLASSASVDDVPPVFTHTEASRTAQYKVAVVGLRDRRGDRIGHIVTCTDITDASRREPASPKNTKSSDEFLALVSHELRAPVTTMLLWEKVLRDQPDANTRAQALDAIRQSAQLQARLVGDLLEVSRAASGKLFVDLRPLVLDDVIAESVEAAQAFAATRRVTLENTSRRAGTVIGDAARLRQVLDNIIANALQFTEPDGRVTVSTHLVRREVIVDITDTGPGITADNLARIFEPFYQTADTLRRHRGGLGLGLAIARQLVQLHGGTLTAASPGLGHGATFSIRMPLSPKRRTRTPSPLPFAIAGTRVLVIDDDPRVREALALLLERIDADVVVAGSAAEARTQLAQMMPDVIVCDIGMPDEDGYSLIRSLRAMGVATPAIALTAHAVHYDADRALQAGFTMHVAKPLQFERLVQAIGAVLSNTRAADT